MSENEKRPFFSIVTPVWNRADVISRCFESILGQDFDDFEIIAVDDGSTDDSVAVMQAYNDLRIRIIRQAENRGVCATRNVGTAAARGKWIVSLDTDWALLSGTLGFFAEMAEKASPDVGVIGGRARTEEGEIWPHHPFPEGPFGFEEYLKWLDLGGHSDYQPCRRREVFDTISWPTDRRHEAQFHLRVARKWKMWVSPRIIASVRTTCNNSITRDVSIEGLKRHQKTSPYLAQDAEEILADFACDLKHWAPNKYRSIIENAARENFISGRRLRGFKYGLKYLRHKPAAIRMILLIIIGLLGPQAWLWHWRLRIALRKLRRS